MRLVQIGIEHDNGKGNQEYRVTVVKGTFLNVACIIFPVDLRERSHDAINLLRFTRKAESTVGQEVSQPGRM